MKYHYYLHPENLTLEEKSTNINLLTASHWNFYHSYDFTINDKFLLHLKS